MPYSSGEGGKLCGRLEAKLGTGEHLGTLEIWIGAKAGALDSEWTSDWALGTPWGWVFIPEDESKGTRETTLSN